MNKKFMELNKLYTGEYNLFLATINNKVTRFIINSSGVVYRLSKDSKTILSKAILKSDVPIFFFIKNNIVFDYKTAIKQAQQQIRNDKLVFEPHIYGFSALMGDSVYKKEQSPLFSVPINRPTTYRDEPTEV